MEDYFARASSTLGPLGKGAQSVSRCQSQEGVEVEGYSHDASAHSATEMVRRSPPEVHAAAHAKIERLQAARWAMPTWPRKTVQ